MKKISLTILLFLTLVYASKAQSITVTGTVTSATDALPMPFVTVAIKGTTNAVATNMDGKFSLSNVSATDSLLFSFVG